MPWQMQWAAPNPGSTRQSIIHLERAPNIDIVVVSIHQTYAQHDASTLHKVAASEGPRLKWYCCTSIEHVVTTAQVPPALSTS